MNYIILQHPAEEPGHRYRVDGAISMDMVKEFAIGFHLHHFVLADEHYVPLDSDDFPYDGNVVVHNIGRLLDFGEAMGVVCVKIRSG